MRRGRAQVGERRALRQQDVRRVAARDVQLDETGTAVAAADDGVVAAITRDTDQVPIMVLRHEGNLLTVYAGVDNITVEKGDSVKRGQKIAEVRAASPSFLHFEVREGFDSVDPVPYLN